MAYNSIVISSGHAKDVRGACGPSPWGLDEVDEARKITEDLARELRLRGVDVTTYHDDVSQTQSENLERITDFHNSRTRDLDLSIHLNAGEEPTNGMRGVEVFWITQEKLASEISEAIATFGCLKNRGPKYSNQLHFLCATAMPALLLEICFVDAEQDCAAYRENYGAIIEGIADVLGGMAVDRPPPPEETCVSGKVSWFGGPEDDGVSPGEGLAFIYEIDDAPHLFLPYQPEGTTGLARRLNPFVHYFAMRFDYSVHPKETLLHKLALIRNPRTGFAVAAIPADWGPHESTDRIADLSPSLMDDLGLETDDVVEVIFPFTGD